MKLNSQLISLSVLLCILAFGSSAYAQTQREITEGEYWKAVLAASAANDQVPYRSVLIEEIYKNGKVTITTTDTHEQISAYTTRYIHVDIFNGKPQKREVIHIGQFYYCREDLNPWEKSTQRCGPMILRGSPAASIVRFTLDETKFQGALAKLYVQTGIFDGRNGEKRFFQYQYWISSEGRMLQEQTIYGLENTKELTSKRTETYEYNPKGLKIEAPIK